MLIRDSFNMATKSISNGSADKFHSLVEWKAANEQRRKAVRESDPSSDKDYGRIAEAEFGHIYDDLVGSPSMDNGVQIDLGEMDL